MQKNCGSSEDREDLERKLEAVVSVVVKHQDDSDSSALANRLDGLST